MRTTLTFDNYSTDNWLDKNDGSFRGELIAVVHIALLSVFGHVFPTTESKTYLSRG